MSEYHLQTTHENFAIMEVITEKRAFKVLSIGMLGANLSSLYVILNNNKKMIKTKGVEVAGKMYQFLTLIVTNMKLVNLA